MAQTPEVPSIEIVGLEKRFGNGPLILSGLNLKAQAGDFVSIIGASGSGKSTLLRLMAGLSPASSGNITVGGQPLAAAGAGISFVFQEPTLLPWLTVQGNVETPLRIGRVPAETRARIAQESIGLVGLSDRSSYFPHQLSGGQKMRVSLARALTQSPTLLLLDEPFGALDEMTRQSLNEELLVIRQARNWTAFFVTHSVAEAVFLSNRVVVLSSNPGRIRTEIAIELPYPRTAETRLTPEYLTLVAEVSRQLQSTGGKS